MFIITSYYTIDTPYQQVVHDYLMNSLNKLNLKSDIRGIEDLGDWQKNTSYKPIFIKHMLEKYPDLDIVFVDADAEVLVYPKMFDEIPEEYDIAVHILDRDSWYNRTFSESENKELLSGTMLIRNSHRARALVEKWIRACLSRPFEWEQVLLQRVLTENGTKIYELPLSYCYIKTMPSGEAPYVKCEDAVIVHNQVSRQFKKATKWDMS